MPSNSKKTSFRRALKHAKSGQDRKRLIAKNGTTPKFPLHTPESHANAPKDQLPKK